MINDYELFKNKPRTRFVHFEKVLEEYDKVFPEFGVTKKTDPQDFICGFGQSLRDTLEGYDLFLIDVVPYGVKLLYDGFESKPTGNMLVGNLRK